MAAGCGAGPGDPAGAARDRGDTAPTNTATAATPTPTPDPSAQAAALLADWDAQLLPLLIVARDRAQADQAGRSARALRLEARLNRGLRKVRRYGRDARKELLGVRATEAGKASISAGDAWTEWADELLNRPPAGDFDQARKIADLAADAVAASQDAYRAAGQEIPPAWQSG